MSDTGDQHDGMLGRLWKLSAQNAVQWLGLFVILMLAFIAGGWAIEQLSRDIGLTIIYGTMVLYILFTPRMTIDGREIGAWPAGAGLRAARRLRNWATQPQNDK